MLQIVNRIATDSSKFYIEENSAPKFSQNGDFSASDFVLWHKNFPTGFLTFFPAAQNLDEAVARP